MKKEYINPVCEVKQFSCERVMTLSGLSSQTYEAAKEALGDQGVTVENIFAFTL